MRQPSFYIDPDTGELIEDTAEQPASLSSSPDESGGGGGGGASSPRPYSPRQTATVTTSTATSSDDYDDEYAGIDDPYGYEPEAPLPPGYYQSLREEEEEAARAAADAEQQPPGLQYQRLDGGGVMTMNVL